MSDFSFVDHFVYAGPNLAEAIDHVEQICGVRPSDGGAHVGLGTRNALLALGGNTYLEVIGPDTEQEAPKGPRPFGIDDLSNPRLVTWASSSSDLSAMVGQAASTGINLGQALPMSRRKPDGDRLEWELTIRPWTRPIEPIPFFIDWGKTPSPAATVEERAELAAFTVFWPEAEALTQDFEALGLPIKAEEGDPLIAITLNTSSGPVRLS